MKKMQLCRVGSAMLIAVATLIVGCSSSSPDSSAEAGQTPQIPIAQDEFEVTPTNPVADDPSSVSPPADTDELDQPVLEDPVANRPGSDNPPVVAAPTGLRGTVYTFQEVELFWNAADDDVTASWQVERNGEVVASVPGPSFYDGDLQASTRYDYVIKAVDGNGVVGGSASLTLETPVDAPVITHGTARALATETLDLMAMSPLRQTLERLRIDLYRLHPVALTSGSIACPAGGTVEIGMNSEPTEISLVFTNCRIDGVRYAGTVTQQRFSLPTAMENYGNARCELNLTDFVRDDESATGPVEVTGTLQGRGEPDLSLSFAGKYVARSEAGSLILDASVLTSRHGDFNGQLVWQSPETGNRPLVATTTERFLAFREGQPFVQGTLQVAGPHGNTAGISIIRDPRHWQLTAETENGAIAVDYDINDGPLPMLTPWPVGAACVLAYAPSGTPLADDPGDTFTDSTEPFSLSNLDNTLDIIFDLQRAEPMLRANSVTDNLVEFATARDDWSGTSITDPEDLLIPRVLGEYNTVDETTGVESTGSYLVFDTTQTRWQCPSAGSLTFARRQGGSGGYPEKTVVDNCSYPGGVLTGVRDSSYAKYSWGRSWRTFSFQQNEGDSVDQLEMENASSSVGGVAGNASNSAERIVIKRGDYNAEVTNYETTWEPDTPSQTVSADVTPGDQSAFTVRTMGSLLIMGEQSAADQGVVEAVSATGIHMMVRMGNEDAHSFDVRVLDSSGVVLLHRRYPYDDRRRIRIGAYY